MRGREALHVLGDVAGLAVALLILLASVAMLSGAQQPYRRAEWRHWADRDGDCQDTRQEVLVAESRRAPTLSPDGCRVVSGEWLDYYTGELVTVPGSLDVDHLVPLANAHRSGGSAWDGGRKASYANDLSSPEHLVAVTAAANRRKGDKGPESWRPPRREAWCRYAAEWATVKLRWRLSATEAELAALAEMGATCPR